MIIKDGTHYPYFSEIDYLSSDLVNDVPIANPGYRTLVESHDVLRQSSRFVRKYVLYLSEFLVKGCCTRPGVRIRGRVVHLLVPVDEERLDETYDLDADVETYRYHCVKDDCVGEKHQDGYDCGAYESFLGYQ